MATFLISSASDWHRLTSILMLSVACGGRGVHSVSGHLSGATGTSISAGGGRRAVLPGPPQLHVGRWVPAPGRLPDGARSPAAGALMASLYFL